MLAAKRLAPPEISARTIVKCLQQKDLISKHELMRPHLVYNVCVFVIEHLPSKITTHKQPSEVQS